VAHAAAAAFEQAGGIVEVYAVKEADIDVRSEDVDVCEGSIAHARCGTSVVQQLTHVFATSTHVLEPQACDGAKLGLALVQPQVDGGTSP
jgi:hypothetical protein